MTSAHSARYPHGRRTPPRDDGPLPTEKRKQPGRTAAFLLALIVHVAFFALIVFGVSWQVKPTAPVVAELWDSLPTKAAPAPAPTPAPVEPPPPPPVEEKKPEPPPPPPVEKKPAVEPQPSKADLKAEIELKAKREREEKERQEKKKREELERADKLKREESEKQKRELAKKEEDRKKVEAEKQRREMEARQRAIDEQVRREQAAQQAREAAAAAAREASMRDYASKIAALIQSRANVPETVSGKPSIRVRVKLLTNGTVFDVQAISSSGNQTYDESIKRAINGIQQWPQPDSPELIPKSRELIINVTHER
jgi:colicin import membrane protein